MPVRIDHVYKSRIVIPKLNPKEFNRGWIEPKEHAPFVGSIEEAAALECSNYCEIGVKRAGTSLCIEQVLNKLGRKADLFCIDIDGKAGAYLHKEVRNKGTCRAQFIHGSSWASHERVPGELAWLMIDGCHCYECTSKDLEAFLPKVVPGGIAIVHDADYRVQLRPPSQACGGARKKVGVYDAMLDSRELQAQFQLAFFIEGCTDTAQSDLYWGGMGIWRRRK